MIALSHAAFGLAEGSAGWPWWVFGSLAAAFAAAYLFGLALAGREKPFA
jgi:hypothetical protein